MQDEKSLKERSFKPEYGQAARQATRGKTSCCGSGSILEDGKLDPITQNLYATEETDGLPRKPLWLPLDLKPDGISHDSIGETVLDLGSGGGIDVFLSARRVGPTGKVYGLDMTDMLAWHRKTSARLVSPMWSFSRARSKTSRCRTIRWI